jgi:pantetheine-phosphate adenylyltransferase
VRGVRSVKDFEYEFQMAQMNKHLANSVDTIMMAPAPEFGHVSSTLVREIAAFGGDVSAFVHPDINTVLLEKFS